jgi:hypothetical protein
MKAAMRNILSALISISVAAFSAPAPKPLAIVNTTLHQYEDGPALASDYAFAPGETFFFSYLIEGYKASEDGTVHVRSRIEAVDPQGTPLMEPADKEIKVELAPEDKNWMPKVRQSVSIPPLTFPGQFRALITVRDELAGTETKTELPFRVAGKKVEPSDVLVVRDFRFLRDEDDRHPLQSALYSRGDALWARFEIVGYKFAEQNRIQVEYGLSVLGPTGKELYSEPRAAVEETSAFYPKRYLQGSLNLNLEKAQPGDYTIVLTVRDGIGNQTFEERHGFRVQ